MNRAIAVLLAACALVGAVSAADRKLLQSEYLGYASYSNFEAPQAARWSAGLATGASAPASFGERLSFTGPVPVSGAFGVNPTGGFAEWKDTTRFDATLPRYSAVGRASQRNTWAADLSAGTKIIPDLGYSAKIRPTIPLTFPVGNVGGTIFPTARTSTVINPNRGYVTAPAPPGKDATTGTVITRNQYRGNVIVSGPPGAKTPAGKSGAPAAKAPVPPSGRRRLMNWGHDHEVKARAPTGPRFTYYNTPPPALIDSYTNVWGDKVNMDAFAKVPSDLVSVSGKTNVNIEPQKPFNVGGGKGDWLAINMARNPTTAVHNLDAAIKWGSGAAVMNNGNPLSVTRNTATLLPNPTFNSGASFRPQLGDRPDGFVEVKSRTNVPLLGVGK